MSSRQALQQAVRYTITTCGIWGMARLFVLTLVVGVHVVELVCIWVAMFMWIVWTPAIVDACATDYMAVLSMMTCYLVHQMELMTAVGAARMCGMMMLWWLDGCLVYNVVVNVSRSRYVGLVVVTCVLLWVMAPGMVPSATSLPTMIVHNNSYNNNNSSSSSSSSSSSTYRVYPTDVYPNSSHLDACPSDAAAGEHRGGNASERSCPPMYNGDEGAAKGAGEAGGSDAAARSADKAMAEEDVLLSSPSRLASTLARVQRSFATSLAEGRGNVDEMGIVDGVVQRYLVFLAQIAEYKALPSPTVFSACCNDDGKEAYKVIITAGLLLATSLVGMNMAIGYQQTAEVKARMRRSGIVLVNYSVMLRKIVRTVVNLICIASFLLTWWLCEVFVLPRAASWLPLPAVIAKGFSVVAACVVIGGVTDMNESIYDLLMRLFGVLNPPSRKNVLMSTDDSADEDEPRRDSDVASFTK